MGKGVNIDPNFVAQQQSLARMQALKQAKGTSAVSGKKLLWIIVPVFVVAVAIVLLFSGVFDKGNHVRYGGALYEISDSIVYELPAGYAPVGTLFHVEDPKKATEDLASDWNLDAQLYINPSEPQKAYISAYGAYLEIRKKK